ncbi:MAG: tautomerase family protein [Aliidongia sp.]
MPLLRFDLAEGRTDAEIAVLLDAAHRAVLEAFAVPERDRYQIVHEHKRSRVCFEDTGLGIERSDRMVLLQITSRPRSEAAKQAFYRLLCVNLSAECGIAAEDVIVSFVENQAADWSFDLGRAQFLTGEL